MALPIMKPRRRQYTVDTDTTNISFIQTAVDLKNLGIKNNTFFLALYDVSLRGVDPYSPFLTDDQVIRILNECIINPWYFIREVSRIPDQGNTKGITFVLTRASLASTWCFINGIDHYEVISRQIGKTQSALAILLWAFLFGTTNSEFMFSNKTAEDSVKNLARLREQRDLLPPYLRIKSVLDDTGKIVKNIDNVKTLANTSNGNSIITKASATSLESADKIGRGNTQPIQFYDEVEFSAYIKTIVQAAGPAYSTASTNAQRNNSAYCRIFVSTPGDSDSQAGKDAAFIISGTCPWTETLYDKPIQFTRDYIADKSTNGIMYIEYSYTALGKDAAWFDKVCTMVLNDPIKIRREIYLQRIRGSSLSPYEIEDIQALADMIQPIAEEIYIYKTFKFDIYTPLVKNKVYFVGVDVANGYNADATAVIIFDPYTFKVVAEFASPHIGVADLIKFLYTLLTKHIPNSLLCIERNANGEAVLDSLRTTCIRSRLYWDDSKDSNNPDEKLDAKGFVLREALNRKYWGIWTGGKTREAMFQLLSTHISEHKSVFVAKGITSEISTLVRTKTGSIKAVNPNHDDRVMAFLMCLYAYYFGKNLSRYGYIQGGTPSPEELNKQATTKDILALLDGQDREFFDGVNFDAYADIDMSELITQANNTSRSVLDPEEYDEHEVVQRRFAAIADPYSRQLAKEMARAEAESEAFNARMHFTTSYKNEDANSNYEYDMPMSLFDELNS